MEDAAIVQLYWDRDERAISATAEKYGSYCGAIAKHILDSPEDAEECVNDTYLCAWKAMPPHRPGILSPFLGRITRNLALNRYRRDRAAKRGGSQLPAVLEELSDTLSGGDHVAQEAERRELIRMIDAFLAELPAEKRTIFLRRYWYFDSVSEIADRLGMTENHVSVVLGRLRRKLRSYLLERGIAL